MKRDSAEFNYKLLDEIVEKNNKTLIILKNIDEQQSNEDTDPREIEKRTILIENYKNAVRKIIKTKTNMLHPNTKIYNTYTNILSTMDDVIQTRYRENNIVQFSNKINQLIYYLDEVYNAIGNKDISIVPKADRCITSKKNEKLIEKIKKYNTIKTNIGLKEIEMLTMKKQKKEECLSEIKNLEQNYGEYINKDGTLKDIVIPNDIYNELNKIKDRINGYYRIIDTYGAKERQYAQSYDILSEILENIKISLSHLELSSNKKVIKDIKKWLNNRDLKNMSDVEPGKLITMVMIFKDKTEELTQKINANSKVINQSSADNNKVFDLNKIKISNENIANENKQNKEIDKKDNILEELKINN